MKGIPHMKYHQSEMAHHIVKINHSWTSVVSKPVLQMINWKLHQSDKIYKTFMWAPQDFTQKGFPIMVITKQMVISCRCDGEK